MSSPSRSNSAIPIHPDRMWKTSSPPVSPKKGRNVRDKLEESPNGRATCQRCGEKIAKGEMRVGVQGKTNTPQGITVWRPRYYHGRCVTEDTKRALKLESAAESRKRARTNNTAGADAARKAPSRASKSLIKSSRKSARTGNSAAVDVARNPSPIATKSPTKSPRKSILRPSIRKQLEKDLRALRSCFAHAQGVKRGEEYKIFQNKSLKDMLEKLPTNRTELMQCWGIKGRRCDQYGESILHVINSYLERNRIEQPRGAGAGARARGGRAVGSVNNSRRQRNTNRTTSIPVAASASQNVDSSDDEVEIIGPVLSIEEIVRQRVREAEVRGEVFEIL